MTENIYTPESSLLFNRPDRRLLKVTGADRQDFFHRLTANDVRTLNAGGAMCNLLLDAKGRVVAAFRMAHVDEAYWLEAPSAGCAALAKGLDGYLFQDDVTITEMGSTWRIMFLAGATAAEVLADALSGTVPEPGSAAFAGEVLVIRDDYPDIPGFRIAAPADAADALYSRLGQHRLVAAGSSELDEALRIQAMQPEQPGEYNPKTLPPECAAEGVWYSTSKGCYVGQEIIERITALGNVAQKLTRVLAAVDQPLNIGDGLYSGDHEAPCGHITSTAQLPDGAAIALAFLKTNKADCEAPVRAGAERIPITLGHWTP